VDDGSGFLEVLLDRDAGFQLRQYEPGAVLDVTGLLIPEPGGRAWRIKPRQQTDVIVTGFNTSTIAQARAALVGTVVSVPATALNAWATFADSTVHLSDATGTIRATRVRPDAIVPGSRMRALGTIALIDGQPTISNVITAMTGAGPAPIPQTVNASTAASANGGGLDAALVRVLNVTVAETGTAGNDIRLLVSDASGQLEVLFDRDAWPGLQPGSIAQNSVLSLAGVLVASPGGGAWRLKPRGTGDLIIISTP
jgi:hypothetical protein